MAAYIFDFDGTIADSFDYVLDFLAREIQGEDNKVRQHHAAYRGLSMRLMAVKLGAAPWQLPFLFLKGRREMGPALAGLQTFEGMPELIRDLHADGHQLFLVSVNLKENIMPFLYSHGLAKYFTEVVGNATAYGIRSKSPALRRLVKKYDLQETWYVGDEGADVRAAKKAGVKAAAVTWGYNNLERLKNQKPDLLAFTTEELRSVVPWKQ